MVGTKVHLFPVIPSLTRETQLYTQRRSAAEAPDNFRFTVGDVIDFIVDEGYVMIMGTYPDDETASADGVQLDEVYELTADNIWALPEGVLKRCKV